MWVPAAASQSSGGGNGKSPAGGKIAGGGGRHHQRRLGHASINEALMVCPKGLESPPIPAPPKRPPMIGPQSPNPAAIALDAVLPDVRLHPLRHYSISSDPEGRDVKYNATLYKSLHYTEMASSVHIHNADKGRVSVTPPRHVLQM